MNLNPARAGPEGDGHELLRWSGGIKKEERIQGAKNGLRALSTRTSCYGLRSKYRISLFCVIAARVFGSQENAEGRRREK